MNERFRVKNHAPTRAETRNLRLQDNVLYQAEMNGRGVIRKKRGKQRAGDKKARVFK